MENENPRYKILLFNSTSGALWAEKLLKKAGIPYKLIPVPRQFSADCGISLRFLESDEERVKAALVDKVEIHGLHAL